MSTGVVVIAVVLLFALVFVTNPGQIVHHTPDPRGLERLGRRKKKP